MDIISIRSLRLTSSARTAAKLPDTAHAKAGVAAPRITPDQPNGRKPPRSQLPAERKKRPATTTKTQTTRLSTFRTWLMPTVLRTPRATITVTSRAMSSASRSGYVSSPLPEADGSNVVLREERRDRKGFLLAGPESSTEMEFIPVPQRMNPNTFEDPLAQP
ncbi:hypothetical protein EYF80_048623 [Liparis tanakae]|uniref:Uncharacterized protein n=1 Tax=Liparis tanakae TaxID=230148 RepID=A0A4Z2FJP3_9TELE|nr:hypothetical protein EYF80_048623 [Liparis tanakae]